MGKIQSAIAEQSTPILMNTNLWNSFIEHRINFKQKLAHKNSRSLQNLRSLPSINDRMEHLSDHYNALSSDASHNKKLVVQCINKEFYNKTKIFLRQIISCYLIIPHYLTHKTGISIKTMVDFISLFLKNIALSMHSLALRLIL